MSRVHFLSATGDRRAPSTVGLVLALGAGSALAGCAPAPVDDAVRGESRLAPRFEMVDRPGRVRTRQQGGQPRDAAPRGRGRPSGAGTGTPAAGTPSAAGSQPTTNETAASTGPSRTRPPSPTPTKEQRPPQAPARPLAASLADPRGDVGGGLGTAPGHVDVTGATVTRSEQAFEVRITFAGALPARQRDNQVQNVAVFFDLDGDALVDYETWGTLSDSGWSGSYRTPDSAHFGSASGVAVRAEGATLVMAFPLSHLRASKAFRWQLGSEWGTYEQVASGTTASDRAGGGGAPFPS